MSPGPVFALGAWAFARAAAPLPAFPGMEIMSEPSTDLKPESTPAPNGLPNRKRSAGTHDVQDPVSATAASRRDPNRLAWALDHARMAARIASENRAKDVLLLDMRDQTPVVDFFVLASTVSRRQAQSAASEIDAEMKKIGELKLGIEGYEDGRWVLLDYGDFVVHVLAEESRAYYGLEELWGDAARLDWRTGLPIDGPNNPAQPDSNPPHIDKG